MGSEFLSRNRRARTAQTRFTHDPYNPIQSFAVIPHGPASRETHHREVAKKHLPAGTLRIDLCGQVPFFAFPEHVMDRTRQRTEAPPLEERPDSLVQLFFGQLPYKVSDNMIVWLCDTFAESDVLYIERVMQEKSRKGCMQVFVDEEDVEFIVSGLNKRVLFDATGVWQAQNEEQVALLEKHCASELHRFKGFPFRPMVVERSTSTYVRRHRPANPSRRSCSTTPPPEEEEHHRDAEALPGYEESIHYDAAPIGDCADVCQCQDCINAQCYIPCEGPYRSHIPPAYNTEDMFAPPYPYPYRSSSQPPCYDYSPYDGCCGDDYAGPYDTYHVIC